MTTTRVRNPAWAAPVLRGCVEASAWCREVTIDLGQVEAVADWMAFEAFPAAAPDPAGLALGPEERADRIDFTLVTTAINFAYTDFATGVPWSVEHEGRELVDADAMFLRFEQALAAGVPVTSGEWLADLTEERLADVLHGPRPIPMLAERVAVLREVGRTLTPYDGRFSTWVASCAPRALADGDGLLERIVADFAAFDDAAALHGVDVRIDKLAQLGLWTLHRTGLVPVPDVDVLSVFADYIVPAALRAMRVLHYAPGLAAAVDGGELLPAGSAREVELRVQTIVACGLLTDALNARRAEPVVGAQVDYRFWSAFHEHIRPHHLTVTTRY